MSRSVEELEAEVFALPVKQRAALADRLVEGLATHPDPVNERVWLKEARRRLEEIHSGRVKLIAGEEGSAKVRRLVRR